MLKKIIPILTLALVNCTNSDNSIKSNTVDTKQTEKKTTLPIRDNTFVIKELSFNKKNEQDRDAYIKLSFTESTITDNGMVYKVNSTYKSKLIGFELIVPNPGLSKLTIKSNGISSNYFIHVLSKLYKQKVDTTLQFTKIITANCINMGDYIDSLNKQSDSNYVSTKSQYKLFFQGKNKDDYAELYLNINKTEHWIELEEKDEGYRSIIIKLLTQK